MRTEADTSIQIVARAISCLAILFCKWRDGSDDPAWKTVRNVVGGEMAAMTVLPRLDSWLNENQDWPGAIKSLLEVIIKQHDRIMYEKGSLSACWIHQEGDKLVCDKEHDFGYPAHSSRVASALSILADLGLVKDDGAGFLPTKEGKSVFLRAIGESI